MKYAWVLLVVTCSALVAASTASASSDCQDTFNCYNLAEAFNGSQPFKAGAQFSLTTDISNYNLQSGERANCEGPNGEVFYGNNSAWYRFDAGVTGTLTVSATTTANGGSGFQIMLIQYEAAHKDPIDFTSNADLPSRQCSAAGTSVHFDTPVQVPVHTSGPTFVQLLAFCGETNSGTSPCPAPIAAGPVKLNFAFTPTDTDGDGVPDTLDQCPNVAAATSTGCPPPPPQTDTDGDGVPDVLDHCQTVPGPAKYGGCPDSDGDGIPDNLDLCPNQAGPASTEGCPDTDGDGIPDKSDKCPTAFAVVGYSTIGDGRLGCPQPLATLFTDGYLVHPAFLALTGLGVIDAPRGARITVLCSGNHCPKRTLTTFVVKKAGGVSVLGRLRAAGLHRGAQVAVPVGDRLTIEATLRGTLGRTRTIVPRRNDQKPRVTEGCLSGKKAIACSV